MRFSPFLLAGAALTLVGCDSSPLAVDSPNQMPAAAVVPQSQGVAPVVLNTWQTSSGVLTITGWCDQSAGIASVSAPGSGVARYMGHFEIQQSGCLNLATNAITNGEATLVAANGDEVHWTYEGEPVQAEPPTSDLHYVIVGGTGRFANAEGEMDIRVVFPTTTTWVSTGTGWMQYAASDRSNH